MKSFDEKPSPPSRKSPSVWQPLAGLSPHALIAASIVSTAMDRYVVHFPPAIVTSPLLLTKIRWLRAIEAVFLEFGSITKGRIPLQAARTSPRRTVRELLNKFTYFGRGFNVHRGHTYDYVSNALNDFKRGRRGTFLPVVYQDSRTLSYFNQVRMTADETP